MDISRVFPRSFDISDTQSEEYKDFREDFKFTFVVSFLKTAEQSPVAWTKQNFEKLILAIGIAERRVKVLSGVIFQEVQANP